MLRNHLIRSGWIGLSLAIAVAAASGCKPSQGAPGVVYASLDVRCGSDVYTLSTGNNSGKCSTTEGAGGHGGQCTGGGGGASMTCLNGVGQCLESEGTGSCSIKAQ